MFNYWLLRNAYDSFEPKKFFLEAISQGDGNMFFETREDRDKSQKVFR